MSIDIRLYKAVDNGNLIIVKQLIRVGAYLDIRVLPWGNTPLMLAIQKGYKDIFDCLIESRASLDKQDKFGHTVLMKAIGYGKKDMVQSLIKWMVAIEGVRSLDIQDNKGRTALMIASQNQNKEIVELLLEAGSNIEILDIFGKTALSFAYKSDLAELTDSDSINPTFDLLIEYYYFKYYQGVNPSSKAFDSDSIYSDIITRSRILCIINLLYRKYIYLNFETIFEMVQTLINENI